MDVYLHPNHYLPSFADGSPPSRRQVETAALLLYCESVTLGRLGFHHELVLPSPSEALEQSKRSSAGQKPKVVRNYFKEGSFEGLTIEELALFNYVRYCQLDVGFQLAYKPLLEGSAVRIVSLAEITRQANVDAQARGMSDAWQFMTIDSVLAGFLLSFDAMSAWLQAPEQKVMNDTFGDTDGIGLTGLYLLSLIADANSKLLGRVSRIAHGEFLYYSVLLELFTQILLSSFMDLRLISLSEAHLLLRNRYMVHVLEVSSALRDGKILRWRHEYAAELQEFRRLCDEVAEDLARTQPGKIGYLSCESESSGRSNGCERIRRAGLRSTSAISAPRKQSALSACFRSEPLCQSRSRSWRIS
jgi:hypothetical protein